MKKLITFGDSWVWGVGSRFTKGMTKDEYDAIKEDPAIAGKNCFRRLLCEEHDMENIKTACAYMYVCMHACMYVCMYV